MADLPPAAPLQDPDPASQTACNHFGCDAQPGEPCSDTSFAGGEITVTPFTIDSKPAFHAERIADAAWLFGVSADGEEPSEEQFEQAEDASGLV